MVRLCYMACTCHPFLLRLNRLQGKVYLHPSFSKLHAMYGVTYESARSHCNIFAQYELGSLILLRFKLIWLRYFCFCYLSSTWYDAGKTAASSLILSFWGSVERNPFRRVNVVAPNSKLNNWPFSARTISQESVFFSVCVTGVILQVSAILYAEFRGRVVPKRTFGRGRLTRKQKVCCCWGTNSHGCRSCRVKVLPPFSAGGSPKFNRWFSQLSDHRRRNIDPGDDDDYDDPWGDRTQPLEDLADVKMTFDDDFHLTVIPNFLHDSDAYVANLGSYSQFILFSTLVRHAREPDTQRTMTGGYANTNRRSDRNCTLLLEPI